MKYKLKFDSIHFENNWKNGRIFKLIEFYFIFMVSSNYIKHKEYTSQCRPIFRFAILNFGFVIIFNLMKYATIRTNRKT